MLKKHRKFLMIFGILVVAFLLFFPFPRKVDISGEFFGWQNNNANFSENRTVALTGTYRKPLIGKPEFRGKLEIQGITEHWETTDIIMLVQSFGKHEGAIFPWFPESGNYMPSVGWHIVYSPDFSQITILMPSDSVDIGEIPDPVSWSAKDAKALTYPAATREEAVALTNKWFPGSSDSGQWN